MQCILILQLNSVLKLVENKIFRINPTQKPAIAFHSHLSTNTAFIIEISDIHISAVL